MSEEENGYEKYMHILDVVFRTCATMLAIIFAYILGNQNISLNIQVGITLLVVFLTVTFLISGACMISGRPSEPQTLKVLAAISFLMMIILVICMLALLLLTIW